MSRRTIARLVVALATPYLLGGCASMIHGPNETIRVDSQPPGATVRILPDEITVTTPARVSLPRKHPHTLLVSLDGHVSRILFIDRITSGAAYGNLLLGGMVGTSTDYETGAAFDLDPDEFDIVLKPLKSSAPPADAEPAETQTSEDADEPDAESAVASPPAEATSDQEP